MSFTELELAALMVCPQSWLAVEWIPGPEAEALVVLLWTNLKGKDPDAVKDLPSYTMRPGQECPSDCVVIVALTSIPELLPTVPECNVEGGLLELRFVHKPLVHHSRQFCLFCPVDISKRATAIAASIPLAWDFAEPDLQRGQGLSRCL